MIHHDPVTNIAPDERIDVVNESIRLIQKKQGLTFGTDAFLLAAFIRPMPHARAVELGGGTGIASLLAATKQKAASICAVEIQKEFAELIGRNAAINGLGTRVVPLCADLRQVTNADVGGEIGLHHLLHDLLAAAGIAVTLLCYVTLGIFSLPFLFKVRVSWKMLLQKIGNMILTKEIIS